VRIPVIVLVDEPGQGKCPKATRLLMGLQHYLAWPDEIDDLLPVARGLLRTSRLLEEAATQPGDPDWIPNLREVGAAQERRDLIAALRATNGNISRAADLLGISRGGLQYRLKKHGVQ
jgi:transcriptional regulator of acetoin/glycerol metabolism